jgi:hypothetical protein
VVGVANVIGDQSDATAVWRDVVAITARTFPARPIVGYERGDDLAHANDSGFRPLGALRVWYRELA